MIRARAFTIIELLLATVLSTVLMIGVLAVITRLGAPDSAAASSTGRHGDSPSTVASEVIEPLMSLLREDLGLARVMEAAKPNEIALEGYAGLDGQSHERTHRPVRVHYRIEFIDGRPWLVRRQAALDVLTNQNIQRDLVCSGVTRIELTTITTETGDSDAAAKHKVAGKRISPAADAAARNAPGERHRGGALWRLRVWIDDGETPAHDRIVAVQGVGQ